MEAAHITWRPLGELFVDRGLITQDELEEALVEQRETRKRLGTILVSRGLVSGPELTSVLVDQLGMELTKESGFGSGLWDEIRKRHERPRATAKSAQPAEVPPAAESAPPAPAEPPAEAPAPEPRKPARAARPAPTPAVNGDEVAAAIEKEREALTAAFTQERAEREMELMQERAALEAALAKERESFETALDAERAARRQAEQALASASGDAAGRAEELAELSGQVAELRSQVQRSAALVTAEQSAAERVKELETELASERIAHGSASESLETRLTALGDALVAAQAKERSALEELDAARGEANVEAKELRASVERVRTELDRLDQAASWFEYWSGARS